MPANSRAGTLQGVLDGQCHREYTADAAAARLRQDWPSGNAPTTRVRRRISRMIAFRLFDLGQGDGFKARDNLKRLAGELKDYLAKTEQALLRLDPENRERLLLHDGRMHIYE